MAQPPPPSTYGHNPQFPPQNVPPARNCCERGFKNKPQSNSVGAVCSLFVSGGLNWGWSCYSNPPVLLQITLHMRLCWFIAGIIGAIVSTAMTRKTDTKLVYLCSSLLVTIGGILFVAQPNNATAIIAARYLDGIGVGMALVRMLVLAGEEVVKEQRGMVTSLLVSMCFSLGIFLNVTHSKAFTYDGYDYTGLTGTELQGVYSIICGIIGLLLSSFLVIESPVHYLKCNQEHEALDALRRLQSPCVVSFETYEWLEELKRYVADNKESGDNGLTALIKLCLYQGLISLSFSSLIFKALDTATFTSAGPWVDWPYIAFGALRLLGTFIAAFTLDSMGRKAAMMMGSVVCGGLTIVIGTIYNSDLYRYEDFLSGMGKIFRMLIAMQLFAGLFISSAPVYNTEAYPLALKPCFIAIGFIVEMLVQIILCIIDLTEDNSGLHFITVGALYIAFFIFSLFALPETKRDPLHIAQRKFRSCWGN